MSDDSSTITREEVVEVFNTIHTAYPRFFYKSQHVDLWFKLLAKIDATSKEVTKAVESHILESEFEPKIASISTRIQNSRGSR